MTPEENQVLVALDRWHRSERAFVMATMRANQRGVSWRRLSDLTGIPTPTLNRWAVKKGHESDE